MTWLRKPLPWLLGAALAAAGQTAVLGAMLWERIAVLQSETVITLKARPLDPRDMFRGDYVILTYDISRHRSREPAGADGAQERFYRWLRTDHAWVVVTQTPEGWAISEATIERPDALPDGAVLLRAARSTFRRSRDELEHWLDYGIERFYVPEGAGRALEDMIGEGRITVDVAVADNGAAGIKALRVDGEIIHEDPLF